MTAEKKRPTLGLEMTRHSSLTLAALVSLSAAISSVASAGPAEEHGIAVAAFQEGTKLVEQGNCPAAIPKFQESLTHQEGVGAHLNLADCYDRVGSQDRAWLEYKAAERFAAFEGNDERREVAHTGAYNLEQKLVRLTLSIPLIEGVELRINGLRIDRDLVAGRLVAIAPGAYKIEARAPGKKPLTTEGSGVAGEVQRITIAFEDEARLPPPKEPAPSTKSPPSKTQRTVALLVGGAGVAIVAVGTVFGLVAISDTSDLKSKFTELCTGTYPTGTCPTSARETIDPLEKNASSAATLSTVFMIVGGAAAATGAVLYLTAPSASVTARTGAARLHVAPSAGQSSGALVVAGSW
jgi:hypothetical protein